MCVCIVGSGAGGAVSRRFGFWSKGSHAGRGGYYDQDNFKLNEKRCVLISIKIEERGLHQISITVLQGRGRR